VSLQPANAGRSIRRHVLLGFVTVAFLVLGVGGWAATTQTRGKLTETELQIIQIDQDLRSEVAKELHEIHAKSADQVERKVAAEDQLSFVDIGAPQGGTIMKLSVHTVGGVVSPAEPLMLVVPAGDKLAVEAKITPQSIDQVRVGQSAALRFAAFNQRTTPEISGEVGVVSADILQGQKSGAA
jgi:HlyD family secretion protein